MRNSTAAVWVVCLCVGTWACALPCAAQAPDQDPTARQRIQVAPPPMPAKPPWGPEQATGAADTMQAGDMPTAWASLTPDDGPEWLQVEFEHAVPVAEVHIWETFNPGAVNKVTAILQNGTERVLWEGADPTVDAPWDFMVAAAGDVVSKSIKVYLDSARVPGWNEIDAVELVAKDGRSQWASGASASSTYAALAGEGATVPTVFLRPAAWPEQPPLAPIRDPFAGIIGRRVVVRLDGGMVVTGTLARSAMGFLVVEQAEAHKTVVVNLQKTVYMETAE